MYSLARRVHLFAALVLFVFVMLYAVSGYVLQFPAKFIAAGPTTKQSVSIAFSGDRESEAFTDYLKQSFDLAGRVRHKEGTRDYMFIGPRGVYTVQLQKDPAQAALTTSLYGPGNMLNRFHHISGFEGGTIYKVWGTCFDLVCVSMILFALSGLYLWHKLTKRRTLGWVLVTVSLVYTTGTALFCIFGK